MLETDRLRISYLVGIVKALRIFHGDGLADEWMADFSASVHDLRKARGFRGCLAPDSYVESQALAEDLLANGSLGVVYPSVRRAGGSCLACFRPALVSNVRLGKTYRFTWRGTPEPVISVARGR